MIPYGRRLVKLRGEKSQEEAAKGIEIATSTLGMYETERRVPRDSIKMAIANYYGTTVQDIFFYSLMSRKRTNTKHRRG